MRQRIFVDRPELALYLALVLAGGCRMAPPGPVLPADAAPVSREQVAGWVAATVPRDPRLLRFKWLFRDERSSTGGRGSARIEPPDSLRFDVVGPFGSNPAAAVVVGDSAAWVQPEDAIRKLVPNYPLLWALLGVARLPGPGAELHGVERPGAVAWRSARGADTVEYLRTHDSPEKLIAEVRQAGQIVGRVETTFGADHAPRSARLEVPSVPARLDVTYVSVTRSDPFGPDIWRPAGR